MSAPGRWDELREEFSGQAGRVRLALAVASAGSLLACLVAAVLIARPNRSLVVNGLLLAAQILGVAFIASLRPNPWKRWMMVGIGLSALGTLIRLG